MHPQDRLEHRTRERDKKRHRARYGHKTDNRSLQHIQNAIARKARRRPVQA